MIVQSFLPCTPAGDSADLEAEIKGIWSQFLVTKQCFVFLLLKSAAFESSWAEGRWSNFMGLPSSQPLSSPCCYLDVHCLPPGLGLTGHTSNFALHSVLLFLALRDSHLAFFLFQNVNLV
jgi:hypothetical protein